MFALVFGLCVALGGALLLATGSELQSRAVFVADGRWSGFLRDPRWLLGLVLLGTAVSTNFVALALAPISAVQSMSIVALAASTIYGARRGRIRVTPQVRLSVAACLVGILGFIAIVATHRAGSPHGELDRQLPVVMAMQAGLAAAGLVALYVVRRGAGNTTQLASLIVGAMEFGTITAFFKVLVGLVLRDGFAEALTRPLVVAALLLVAVGGLTAGAQFQLAHTVLPAPTVVAGLTITETMTAAAIGILVLRESALTPATASLLVLFGLTAVAGVIGMRNLRRVSAPAVPSSAVPSIRAPHS